jgi:hypothetical protein
MPLGNKAEFVRALARYLAGRNAVKMNLALSTGIGRDAAERWLEIRNATPLQGYPTIDEAEETLGDWLGIYPNQPIIHLHQLNEIMEKAWKEACEKDPGLAEAFDTARIKDPNIGWLEVAAKREKERYGR